jgi:hypothetical protein
MARGIRRSELETSLREGPKPNIEISKEDCVYLALFPNGIDQEILDRLVYSEKAKKFREYLSIEWARLEL